ncbi:outer membrane protein assembly factor BamB [Vibrio sp. RC27]
MTRWLKHLFVVATITGAVVGCSSETDTVVMVPVPEVNSKFLPTELWHTSISDGVEHYYSKLKPVYAYERIYLASRNGEVKAISPSDGKTIWKTKIDSESVPRLSGGISVSSNTLYIGSENGVVYAINALTGEATWKSKVSGEVLSTPAIDAGLVIVNTSEGTLIALDQTTGAQRWTIASEVPNLTLRGDSSPLALSGGIFWGTPNGRLAAAISSHGQMIWQQTVGTPKGATEIERLVDVDSSPLAIGGILYSIGYNGQLVAVDLRSSKVSWKRPYSSASDMATDGGRLFIVADHDHLVAVDSRSGAELWTNKELENRLLTNPVVLNDYLVVGDSEGYLYWLERSTGNFVARQFIDESGLAVAPIELPDGYLVITRNGDVKKLTIE